MLTLVILRQTIGWHKKSDAISYSLFCKKTGIKSRSTVSASIKHLEKLGLISVIRTPNHTSIFEYIGSEELVVDDRSTSDFTNSKANTSPEFEPVGISDQSKLWTPTSPESGPEISKTSPETGQTKDILQIKKETSSSSTLKQHLLLLDKELIFPKSFYQEAEKYLQHNHLDYKYCDWLYETITTKRNIASITGYFYKLFFEENMKDLYLLIKETNQKQTMSIICPICDASSTNSIICTSCGTALEGLTYNKIKRERAIRSLSNTLFEEYSNRYNEITKKFKFGKLFNKELAKLDDEFCIPIIIN